MGDPGVDTFSYDRFRMSPLGKLPGVPRDGVGERQGDEGEQQGQEQQELHPLYFQNQYLHLRQSE